METLDIGKELGKMKPKEKDHKIKKLLKILMIKIINYQLNM